MLDAEPCNITEPEGYVFPINLQGAATSVPTRLKGRNNYTLTRTGVGVLKISFPDDPGVFMGITGVGFGDPTATVVLGWTVASGTFTPQSGATPASLVVTIGNSSFAAADLAATSTLSLQLTFKRAATDL